MRANPGRGAHGKDASGVHEPRHSRNSVRCWPAARSGKPQSGHSPAAWWGRRPPAGPALRRAGTALGCRRGSGTRGGGTHPAAPPPLAAAAQPAAPGTIFRRRPVTGGVYRPPIRCRQPTQPPAPGCRTPAATLSSRHAGVGRGRQAPRLCVRGREAGAEVVRAEGPGKGPESSAGPGFGRGGVCYCRLGLFLRGACRETKPLLRGAGRGRGAPGRAASGLRRTGSPVAARTGAAPPAGLRPGWLLGCPAVTREGLWGGLPCSPPAGRGLPRRARPSRRSRPGLVDPARLRSRPGGARTRPRPLRQDPEGSAWAGRAVLRAAPVPRLGPQAARKARLLCGRGGTVRQNREMKLELTWTLPSSCLALIVLEGAVQPAGDQLSVVFSCGPCVLHYCQVRCAQLCHIASLTGIAHGFLIRFSTGRNSHLVL
ncbi:uncharacterized protein LOC115071670 [Nannospalax galili]|uniref:uncharacterized protein LOC115071670 n=1 Tax=Nannospalax galili TaxID=1026970 RepID=UPI00111C80DE|nr:uncharacterized protein LOC115071670 [Nannospalax galili]